MNADILTAARNNAEWCDIFCRTHGIIGAFHATFWASSKRTPPYYPDAVTLDPAAAGERILEVIDMAPQDASVKDSFATLDLSRAGFRILFEGEWIRRAAGWPAATAGFAARWRRLSQPDELESWEAAWSGDGSATGLFRPELLEHDSVSVLAGYLDDRVVAGAIVNRSHAAAGVSNLFTTAGDVRDAWPGCLDAIARTVPGLPVVGYESRDALAAAHEHGFRSIGQLRVWIKDDGGEAGVPPSGYPG
jgi:hypothetical protein